MNETELAEILRRMHRSAPSVSRVITLSGISASYLTEVHKGIRLAKHVELNDRIAAYGFRLP